MKPANYLTSSLLDIIFEHKNKNYGAYQLRMTYPGRLRQSLLFTASFMGALSLIFILSLLRAHRNTTPPLPPKSVELSSVKIKEQEPPKILLPKLPSAPKMAAQIKYAQIDVVKDQLVRPEQQPPDLDQIKQQVISLQTKGGSLVGQDAMLVDEKSTGVTATPERKKPYISVEQMPHFRGTHTDEQSNKKVLAFIAGHIHYPAVAREQGIEGIITVQFVVAADGKLQDIHVIGKTPGGGIAEEAIRVVSQMPDWTPGRQNGNPVAVLFSLPIHFTLK